MKNFIKGILVFPIPIVLLIAFSFIYSNRTIKAKFDKFRFSADIHQIIMGDSHIEMAINDRLLGNIKNIANISESFIYSFYKLKTLIKNNPQIDTVFLGASFHSFSDYYDSYYIYNHLVMGRYFYTLPIDVQSKLLKKVNNPVGFLLKSYISWSIFFLNTYGINDRILGGYNLLATEFRKTDVSIEELSINRRIRYQYFRDKELREFSTGNIEYFNSIAEYCRENGVSLIILNTPMHPSYKEKVPRKFFDRFYSLINDNHLELIEFDGLVLTDEDFHSDGDHLNEKGSILATKYFGKYIEHKGETRAARNK